MNKKILVNFVLCDEDWKFGNFDEYFNINDNQKSWKKVIEKKFGLCDNIKFYLDKEKNIEVIKNNSDILLKYLDKENNNLKLFFDYEPLIKDSIWMIL